MSEPGDSAIINTMELLNTSELLPDNELQQLAVLSQELIQTFETAQVFRTYTEMIVSVLNDAKHPTPDSKYWQAVREQKVMYSELVSLSYEYRKKQIELKKLQRSLFAESDELEKELIQIEIEQNQWLLKNMEKTAHDRFREIMEWSKIKDIIKPEMKYGVDNVDAHQLEAMQQRFRFEASLVNDRTPIADARNILGLNHMAQSIGDKIHAIR